MAKGGVDIVRVYEDPGRRRGEQRVLVDRLWPRGLSKEVVDYDEWAKEARRAASCGDGTGTTRPSSTCSPTATGTSWPRRPLLRQSLTYARWRNASGSFYSRRPVTSSTPVPPSCAVSSSTGAGSRRRWNDRSRSRGHPCFDLLSPRRRCGVAPRTLSTCGSSRRVDNACRGLPQTATGRLEGRLVRH